MRPRRDCYICRKQAGKEEPPPGGYLLRGAHFMVCHGSPARSTLGTVLVESRRHFLDYGEMRAPEVVELGSMLRRLFPAVKRVTKAERVYAVALMEGVPHFHLWLVPRKRGGRLRGVRHLARRHAPVSSRAAAAMARRIQEAVRSRTRR
jgi:diadenosine tetraphosphate (Ap4A) HIT family hydrolase